MPAAELDTLEAAHDHIAGLRGAVDRLTEVIGAFTGAPIQVTDPLVAIDPVNGGPEGWHTLGTLAGATVSFARYRMRPDGFVYLQIDVAFAGSTAAGINFANTLPAAYRPLGTIDVRSGTMGQTNAAGGLARIFVGSAGGGSPGTVQLNALANVIGSYIIEFEYPVI